MKEPATYPASVWSGLSDNPNRTSLNDDIPPDTRDWDRLVAEVIATQTQLDTVDGTTANSMHWQSNWAEATAYVTGDTVYHAADYIYYTALSDNVGKTPGDAESIGIWEPISQAITGLPAITGAALPIDGHYALTVNGGDPQWGSLVWALPELYTSTPTLDNRFETFRLDPSTSNVVHGRPMCLIQTVPAKATGTGNGGVITANSATETDLYNGWTLTVVEDVSGNTTNPVTVEDTANQTFICTVNNTANTTFNAIITSWNAAATGKIVVDLTAGTYDPTAMAPADVVVTMGTDGVTDEIQCTTANGTANAKEATVYGLAYNDMDEAALTPGDDIQLQTAGYMMFTANQASNTFNTGIDGSNNLIPGSAYYLAGALVENEPETANTYSTPIGVASSKSTLRLHLGLPIKTTV